MTLPSTPAAEPRRSFPRWIFLVIGLVVMPIVLAICAIVSIGFLTLLGTKVEKVDAPPTVLTASDGQSQLSVPSTWKTSTELNDTAEIQAGNAAQEQYVVVLTENKEDLAGGTLKEYAQVVRDQMEQKLTNATISGPRSLTINGRPALQYEVRGTTQNIKAVYWVTCVEGNKNFFQVITWTLASKADTNREALQNVTESFKETVK